MEMIKEVMEFLSQEVTKNGSILFQREKETLPCYLEGAGIKLR